MTYFASWNPSLSLQIINTRDKSPFITIDTSLFETTDNHPDLILNNQKTRLKKVSHWIKYYIFSLKNLNVTELKLYFCLCVIFENKISGKKRNQETKS